MAATSFRCHACESLKIRCALLTTFMKVSTLFENLTYSLIPSSKTRHGVSSHDYWTLGCDSILWTPLVLSFQHRVSNTPRDMEKSETFMNSLTNGSHQEWYGSVSVLNEDTEYVIPIVTSFQDDFDKGEAATLPTVSTGSTIASMISETDSSIELNEPDLQSGVVDHFFRVSDSPTILLLPIQVQAPGTARLVICDWRCFQISVPHTTWYPLV